MINKNEEKEGRHTLAITRQDLGILKYLFWFLSNICWVWNYRSWLFFSGTSPSRIEYLLPLYISVQ